MSSALPVDLSGALYNMPMLLLLIRIIKTTYTNVIKNTYNTSNTCNNKIQSPIVLELSVLEYVQRDAPANSCAHRACPKRRARCTFKCVHRTYPKRLARCTFKFVRASRIPKKACAMHYQIRARIAHAQKSMRDAPSNSGAHRAYLKRRARCTFQFVRALLSVSPCCLPRRLLRITRSAKSLVNGCLCFNAIMLWRDCINLI